MGEGIEQEKLYVKKGWSNFLKGPDLILKNVIVQEK